MSILTLAEIKTEIKRGLGGRADLDNRMDNIVDLSQLRIARLHDFDELRMRETATTVVTADEEADKVISFPTLTNTRIRKIYSIRRKVSGQLLAGKLIRVLTKKWDRVIPEPEYYSRGYPTHYTWYQNNEFELWRVPDAAYTLVIRLSRWPYQVATTGEGNPIDLENVDDLVINLSLSYAFHSLGRSDKAREFFGIYRAMAAEALIEDTTDLDQAMAGMSMSGISASRGYDDPFVESIAGDLGFDR
jgi:hypothetical protein